MRVLLTSPSMQAGGAERMLTLLATGLASRGHDVAVVAPHGVRDQDLRSIPHLRLPLGDHGRARLGTVRSALQLARAIHRFRPDIVHAQNVKSAVTARMAVIVARPRLRPRILATFHGVDSSEYGRAATLLRTADQVACVSSDLRDGIVAAGLPVERASLVRNAVATAAPLDAARRAELDHELDLTGGPVVAIVGRLVQQKAHERFVVAASIVAENLPMARFIVVGDGPRREMIERQVAAARLTGRLHFTGVRSDARDIIARADVLVFSSVWEGLSLAALEALAAGTPVVSTDVQGMHELLDGGAGAVVGLDDGTALGERLSDLLRNDGERAEMGRAGQELIGRDFSLEGMIDAYERLYERLSSNK